LQAVMRHGKSSVGGGRWQTQGGIDKLVVSRAMVRELQALMPSDAKADRGSVIVEADKKYHSTEIVFGADWNLSFAGALAGTIDVRRLSGDLIVPANPDFPLGLRDLGVHITATPAGASSSRLATELKVD